MAKEDEATQLKIENARLLGRLEALESLARVQPQQQITEAALRTPGETYAFERAKSIVHVYPDCAVLGRGGLAQPLLPMHWIQGDVAEGMSGQFPDDESSGAAVVAVRLADGDSIVKPSWANAGKVGHYLTDPKTLERGRELWLRKLFPDFHTNPGVTARDRREFIEDLWNRPDPKKWRSAPWINWLKSLSPDQSGPKMVPKSLRRLVKAGRLEVIKVFPVGADGQHGCTEADMAGVWTAPALSIADLDAAIAALRPAPEAQP